MSKTPVKKDPIPEIFYKIGEILKRLKILEERTHSFAEKLENLNNEIVELKKDLTKTKAEFNNEIEKIKKQLSEINNRVKVFERELPRLAKKNEIEVLKKVFSLWDPMNFISEKELEFILEDKFEEFKSKLIKELSKISYSKEISDSIKNIKVSSKSAPREVKSTLFNKETLENKVGNKIKNNIIDNVLNNPILNKKTTSENVQSGIFQTKNNNPLQNLNPSLNLKQAKIKEYPLKKSKNEFQRDEQKANFNNNEVLSLIKPTINPNQNLNKIDKEKEIENKPEVKEEINSNAYNVKSNKEESAKKLVFKHIKVPKKFLEKNEKFEEKKEVKPQIFQNYNLKNNLTTKKEKLEDFLDVKEMKNQKLKKIEDKFKEKIKKSYEEFSKDWVEL